MATYIKTLKEDNGDITYPQTKAGAVYTDEGSDAQTVLDSCARFVEGSSSGTIKAVTLKDKDGNVLYPVTSMDLIAEATYREATLPSGNINLPANTHTQVQTLTLPAGRWRVCYMVRGYYSGNPAIVETYLYDENSTVVFDLAINAPVAYGTTDARWQAVASPVVDIASGTKTYKTMVRCAIAGTISGSRGYLYAFRVG